MTHSAPGLRSGLTLSTQEFQVSGSAADVTRETTEPARRKPTRGAGKRRAASAPCSTWRHCVSPILLECQSQRVRAHERCGAMRWAAHLL